MTNDHVHKPNDIIKTIESWYERIIKNNVVPYYVFDEVKHCIKSKTHANLSDNRNKAKIAFDSFYESWKEGSVETSDDENYQAIRNIKSIATPNLHALKLVTHWIKKEGIKYCCAPFEAEWRCVCQIQAWIVDAVMSKDGDCEF